jgi:hypothetical protein
VTIAANRSLESVLHASSVRHRRHVAMISVTLAVGLIAAAASWLATSGVLSTNIQPIAGSASNGQIADINSTTLTGQVVSGGHLTVGVPVSRVVAASSYVDNTTTHNNVLFSVSWANAVQATLHGNDLIAVGLGIPVSDSSGTCSGSALYVADSQVTTNGTGVCVLVDTAATGPNVVTSSGSAQQGMLLLQKSLPGGSLTPGTTPPASVPLCTTSVVTWCQPVGVGDQTVGGTTNVTFYLVAQVVNNGGHVPPGQQPSPGNFQFFVAAKAIG